MKRQVLDPDKARVIRLQADLVREEGFSVRSQIGRSDASSSTPPGCCRSSPNRLGARSPTSSTPKGTRCRLVARSPGRRSRRISPSACANGSKDLGENAAGSVPEAHANARADTLHRHPASRPPACNAGGAGVHCRTMMRFQLHPYMTPVQPPQCRQGAVTLHTWM
jgi:hypothetical protein